MKQQEQQAWEIVEPVDFGHLKHSRRTLELPDRRIRPTTDDILSTYSTKTPRAIETAYRLRSDSVQCSCSHWYNKTQCLVAAGRLAKVRVGGLVKIIKVKDDI